MRLRSNTLAKDILTARNTLTQRTSGPKCAFSIELEMDGLKAGDYVGLVAFQSNYGTVGIKVDENNGKKLLVCKNNSNGQPIEESSFPCTGKHIFLKIVFDFENSKDIASFYFSEGGSVWNKIGQDLKMQYTLDLFIGYRIGIYYYSEREAGGYADFRNFIYEEVINI